MARIDAAHRPRRKTQTSKTGRGAKAPLAGGDLLAVIDELEMLELTLETVPTLSLLARMVANLGRHEARDSIARLGERRGIDVDKAEPPVDVFDAAMAPDVIVEAVRWRLQRVSAALGG